MLYRIPKKFLAKNSTYRRSALELKEVTPEIEELIIKNKDSIDWNELLCEYEITDKILNECVSVIPGEALYNYYTNYFYISPKQSVHEKLIYKV